MARPKRKSDEIYNERRRARRLIERMKRDNAKATSNYSQSLINRLEQLVAGTYAKANQATKSSITKAVESLKKLATPIRDREKQAKAAARRAAKVERRNAIFKQKLHRQKEAKMRAFWRATQQIWENKVGRGDRLKEIINYFGDATTKGGKRIREYYKSIDREFVVGDLQQIYDFIQNENEDVIAQIEEAGEVPEQYQGAISQVVTYG